MALARGDGEGFANARRIVGEVKGKIRRRLDGSISSFIPPLICGYPIYYQLISARCPRNGIGFVWSLFCCFSGRFPTAVRFPVVGLIVDWFVGSASPRPSHPAFSITLRYCNPGRKMGSGGWSNSVALCGLLGEWIALPGLCRTFARGSVQAPPWAILLYRFAVAFGQIP